MTKWCESRLGCEDGVGWRVDTTCYNALIAERHVLEYDGLFGTIGGVFEHECIVLFEDGQKSAFG